MTKKTKTRSDRKKTKTRSKTENRKKTKTQSKSRSKRRSRSRDGVNIKKWATLSLGMFGGNAANKLIKEDFPSTIPSSHGDNFITYPGLRGDRLIEKDYPYVTNDRLIEKDYDEYMTNDQLMEEAYSRYGKIVY